MPSARIIAVLLLCAAPSARAQSVFVPAEAGRVSLSAPVPQLPTLPALSAPAFAPTLLAASPLLLAPAPVASAPAPLKLTAVSAAVAQFSKVDLRSAPAVEARGAADDLMARALGAETVEAPALALGSFSAAADAPLAPASAPEPAREPAAGRVHLLSKPLHETVELGPVARVLHYTLETAFQFGKAAVAWHATGSVTAGLGVLAFELFKAPAMITAQSLTDLGLRYWWRKLSTVREIAKTPGVTRIRVLTTGEAEFTGILARRQENTGLVFVDAEGPLPAEVAGFGAPLPVADLDSRRVRLVLQHDDRSELVFWRPTLGELLGGQPVPPNVAAAWRARLDADKKGKSPLQRLLDFSKEKELKVEAYLSGAGGGERYLGTLAFGRSVKRLVGLGRWDRLKALFGAKPVARAIPLSDTAVERGGKRAVDGAARRVWRRLTGRLISLP